MTDYSVLVERLRRIADHEVIGNNERAQVGALRDAAAAIESLVVEVERLKQYAPLPGGTPIGFVTRDLKIEAQRERIERLEADAKRYQGIRRAYFAGDMDFADRMDDLDADATWDEFDASIDAALEEKS